MSRINFVRLFSVLALAFGASGASAFSASIITYAVGTCRPGLRSFHRISRALAAVPSANVIDVCPGTYDEQLEITHPVTLEGVSNGTSARAIIAPPAGGLVTNAMDDFGNPLVVQLWVNNASGPVNISDLTVDGSGNGVPCCTNVVGIFYQNSSGTVSRVATRNQSGNTFGIAIFAEGGSSNPLVTIENCSVHDYNSVGIFVNTHSLTPELTAVIKGNEVVSNASGGILIGDGSVVTVTSNLIANTAPPGLGTGITGGWEIGGSTVTGSISGNTVVGNQIGISISADGISVTSNKIFNSGTGIRQRFVNKSTAAIQSNSITSSAYHSLGIDFGCSANPNVHSNIITDTFTGLDHVPSATTSSNKYFNVDTIRGTDVCPEFEPWPIGSRSCGWTKHQHRGCLSVARSRRIYASKAV